MPKAGYESVTINKDMGKILDTIATKEYCRTKAEVVRLLVRNYEKQNQVDLRNSGNDNSVSRFLSNDHMVMGVV